ncbi:MAG: 8-amino-7-oxononanoate synthase [Myxococcota bacterium]
MDTRRPELDEALAEESRLLRDRDLWRELREIEGAQGPCVSLFGREILLFCSNNYLGLANHPEVVEAAADAARLYGASAASSRLISGHMASHRALEATLAEWKGCEAALVFSTGYQANLGCMTALVGPGDVVLSDELNHASLIDAARLSRAEVRIFRHNDVDHLETLLREVSGARRALVATESVFSMDGDTAPLVEIAEAVRRHRAWLMVDEAHGVGVFGKTGAGLVEELGLGEAVDVQIGTLGKALGSFGAYATGSRVLVDWLVNRARSFIYTTGLPPASAAAARAAIGICRREPERAAGLRRRVRELGERLRRSGWTIPRVESQILPVRVGEADRAVDLARQLLDRGLYVAAIRPPTVPAGTSRLRLSVMATHTDEQLERVARSFEELAHHTGGSHEPS